MAEKSIDAPKRPATGDAFMQTGGGGFTPVNKILQNIFCVPAKDTANLISVHYTIPDRYFIYPTRFVFSCQEGACFWPHFLSFF
ncbi:MAG: hypothetical protein LBK61_06935 [Spirochaetaceae bacterium]|jgi:hypothetical protein|nr:hypothetical protein [Spirochaetaceae bacterium]